MIKTFLLKDSEGGLLPPANIKHLFFQRSSRRCCVFLILYERAFVFMMLWGGGKTMACKKKKKQRTKLWTRRNNDVWYHLIKRCKKLPRLRRRCWDTVMFENELMPILLLPVKKLTLPPSDVVRLSCTNYSAKSNRVCSILPRLRNCA